MIVVDVRDVLRDVSALGRAAARGGNKNTTTDRAPRAQLSF
jgi:hypothetical protein